MFEPPPELAPDLEWMLGSDQVSREMLLDTLAAEYYLPIFQLALILLDDQAAAHKATQQAIAGALASKYSFPQQSEVHVWLYRLVFQTCQQVERRLRFRHGLQATLPMRGRHAGFGDSLPETQLDAILWLAFDALSLRERFGLALQRLHAWSLDEISLLFGLRADETQAMLDRAWENLLLAVAETDAGLDNKLEGGLATRLHESLAKRWPTAQLSDQTLNKATRRIDQLSKRLTLRRSGLSHFKELVFVLLIILVAALVIWGSNSVIAIGDPTQTPLPTILVTKIVYVEAPDESDGSTGRAEPTAEPSSTPLPVEALYQIDYSERLADIAGKLGVTESDLRRLNRLPPDDILSSGQQLLIPGRLPSNPPAATPLPAGQRQRPLSEPYSKSAILERLSLGGNHLYTLWLDALVADYGPPGYIGPPRVLRVQAWLGEAQTLILAGAPHKGPEDVWLRQEERWYQAQPGRQPWFFTAQGIDAESTPFFKELELLVNTAFDSIRELEQGTILRALERDAWAGYQALLVEQKNQNEQRTSLIWLEDTQGIVLRKQWFSQANPELLVREVAITNISYDVDFPQGLFDVGLPWRGGFAQDYGGAPEVEDSSELPAFIHTSNRQFEPLEPRPFILSELDFLDGQLTFDYRYDFNTRNPSAQADVYLDGLMIGTALFGNPWTMACQRSPDGRLLAYVSQPQRLDSLDSELRWLNLANSFGYGRALEDMVVTHFAWAPDSRRMAVFGYDPRSPLKPGQLIILDSQTGERRTILEVDAANSLVWRPDGARLALIVRPIADSYEEQVWVVDPDRGNVVIRIPIDVDNAYSEIWPMEDWGVKFPILMDSFEACVAPLVAAQPE